MSASRAYPVKFGLVATLNRPGGNVTGVSFFTIDLEAKRVGVLHELVPKATAIAVLVNRTNANAENQLRELSEAARTLGLQLHALNASSERDFDAAFAAVPRCVRERYWWRVGELRNQPD
ncbi:MAG TPA: ABC transporter substrate binding protein [Pseudolabrys sp.]|nr:ABC transporter substrate binding protein [Pseudolabrys sp.]